PELVVDVIGASTACNIQVDRILIIFRWRPWSRANFFHVGRPLDGKRVRSPNGLKELAIGSPGKAIRDTGRIRQTHFHRIRRGTLRLFGAWILQAVAARPHIPEIPTHIVALKGVVVSPRSEGCVHVALRLSVAESRPDRSRIRYGRLIQRLNRPSESRLRRVAETARFVLIDRKMFIEDQ